MSVPIWPTALPRYVDRSGHRFALGDGRLHSPTDTGPGQTRRRFSAAPKPFTAPFTLTTDQRAVLEQFWEVDTDGGTLPFMMRAVGLDGQPWAMPDGTPVTMPDGTPIVLEAWWLVQFDPLSGPPDIVPSGNKWLATCQMRAMP